MQTVVSVDPFRCKMWEYHDRLEEGITEENCKDEIESFIAHGQQIPVLGRSIRQDCNHDAELIFGARRLFIARHLKLPLRVELRDISDRDAFIVMDVENRQRRDISAYERGLSYARCLRSKQFKSQEDVAHAFRISPAQVSRLLKVANLPSVIVGAFASAGDLRETWALELHEAWQDPLRRRALADTARSIASLESRPKPEFIFNALVKRRKGRSRQVHANRDEVVKDRDGSALFRIRYGRSSVALLLPADKISSDTLALLKRAVSDVLQDASLEVPEFATVTRLNPSSRSMHHDSSDDAGRSAEGAC